MKRLFAPVLGCLFLAGCFDAEVSLDFQDKDTVEITTITNFDRAMVEMIPPGSDPCAGSEFKMTEEAMICFASETMAIEELMSENTGKKTSGLDATQGSRFERLDEVTYRVTIDFQEIFDAAAQNSGSDMPQIDNSGMKGMFEAAFSGRDFTIRITGHEIVESSGEVNEDRTEAMMRVPITALMTPGYDYGTAFTTTVRTEKDCRFFVFC